MFFKFGGRSHTQRFGADQEKNFRRYQTNDSQKQEIADSIYALERGHQGRAAERRVQDEHNARWQRRTGLAAIGSALLGFVAIGFTAVGAWLAHLTELDARQTVMEAQKQTVQSTRQANYARESYLAANRPWLQIGDRITERSVFWTKWGISIAGTFEVTNNGSAPSLETSLYFISDIKTGDFYSTRHSEHICKTAAENVIGVVVFPKNQIPKELAHAYRFISWERVNNFRNGLMKASNQSPPNHDVIGAEGVACVRYKIPGDDTWHYTGRLYDIGKATMSGGTQVGFDGIPFKADLSGETVSFDVKGDDSYAD